MTPLALVVPALLGRRARPLPFLLGFLPALVLPALPYALTGGVFGALGEAGLTWKAESAVFDVVDAAAGPAAARATSVALAVAGLLALSLLFRGRGQTAAVFAWSWTLVVLLLPSVHPGTGSAPRRSASPPASGRRCCSASPRHSATCAGRRRCAPTCSCRSPPTCPRWRPSPSSSRRGDGDEAADAGPRDRRPETGPELSVIGDRSHNGAGPEVREQGRRGAVVTASAVHRWRDHQRDPPRPSAADPRSWSWHGN